MLAALEHDQRKFPPASKIWMCYQSNTVTILRGAYLLPQHRRLDLGRLADSMGLLGRGKCGCGSEKGAKKGGKRRKRSGGMLSECNSKHGG